LVIITMHYMSKLHVLIVEDDNEKLGALLDRLSDTTFDVDVRNGPNEALKRVQNKRFNVIFIDLQLTKEEAGTEPFYDGIALGEKVRKLVPDAAMVMYSGSISKGCEEDSEHYKVCMNVLKADAVMARSELFSMPSQVLETRIQEWLAVRRRLSAGLHVQFDTDLRTQAAREVFGDEITSHLVTTSAKSLNHFKVSALQAGYSGAAVLRVKAAQSQDFAAAIHLVVKLSKSEFALQDELQRRPIPGSHFDTKSVTPHGQEVIERDGVYAIAIPEVRNMLLLRDFLSFPGFSKRDQNVLSRVIRDLLIPPAQDARPYETFNLPAASYQLRATAISEIVDFLTEAAGWRRVLKPVDFRAIKATRAFVELVLKGVWSFTKHGRLAAHLHGDFHCRNVFTALDDGPVLIDFGRSEVYPRLFDLAALDTDIVLSVIDSNKGTDHEFGNVDSWFNEITTSFPYTKKIEMNAPTKAAWLRQKLLSEMLKELPSVLAAEYAETLVFHFLRYLRFGNIPLPKKILATRLIEHLTKKFGLLPKEKSGASNGAGRL